MTGRAWRAAFIDGLRPGDGTRNGGTDWTVVAVTTGVSELSAGGFGTVLALSGDKYSLHQKKRNPDTLFPSLFVSFSLSVSHSVSFCLSRCPSLSLFLFLSLSTYCLSLPRPEVGQNIDMYASTTARTVFLLKIPFGSIHLFFSNGQWSFFSLFFFFALGVALPLGTRNRIGHTARHKRLRKVPLLSDP